MANELSASIPRQELESRVRIRPLEWYEPTDHPQDLRESSIAVAHGIGGRYSITGPELINRETGEQRFLLWMASDEFVWKPFRTIAEAREAAEADWQATVSTLLTEVDNAQS